MFRYSRQYLILLLVCVWYAQEGREKGESGIHTLARRNIYNNNASMCGRKRGRKKREYHHYVVTMIFFLSIQHRKRESRGALRFIRFDGGSHDVIAAARLFVYWKQTSSYLINDPLADTEKGNVNLFGCFFFVIDLFRFPFFPSSRPFFIF